MFSAISSTSPTAASLYGRARREPEPTVRLPTKVVGAIPVNINVKQEIAALGYAIARSHWGQGLVPEAARAVIQWGFEAYGLAKIYASADPRNKRSQRVMEKLGMRREGVLRSHRKDDRGERTDEVRYGILREEWSARFSSGFSSSL